MKAGDLIRIDGEFTTNNETQMGLVIEVCFNRIMSDEVIILGSSGSFEAWDKGEVEVINEKG